MTVIDSFFDWLEAIVKPKPATTQPTETGFELQPVIEQTVIAPNPTPAETIQPLTPITPADPEPTTQPSTPFNSFTYNDSPTVTPTATQQTATPPADATQAPVGKGIWQINLNYGFIRKVNEPEDYHLEYGGANGTRFDIGTVGIYADGINKAGVLSKADMIEHQAKGGNIAKAESGWNKAAIADAETLRRVVQ